MSSSNTFLSWPFYTKKALVILYLNFSNPFYGPEMGIESDTWYEYFQNLKYVKSKSDNRLNVLHQILSVTDTIRIFIPLNTVVKDKEILNCIGKLKNNKASGLDGIKNEMIKLGTSIFLPCQNNVNRKAMISS